MHKSNVRKLLASFATLSMTLGYVSPVLAVEDPEPIPVTFYGTVTDAGQVIDKMVIDYGDQEVSGVTNDTYTVHLTSTVAHGVGIGSEYSNADLKVVKTEVADDTVTVYFDLSAGATLTWLGNENEQRNYPANLEITVTQNADIQVGEDTEYSATYTNTVMTYADLVDPEVDEFTSVNASINYQIHKGTNDTLIVWFHGNGEGDLPTGQTNNNIAQVLANRGTVAWITPEAQAVFGDATVMAFQAPNAWYYATADNHQLLKDAKAEIDAVIEANGINPEKVYVSGCSAGGFMTTRMLIDYPNFFKAAMINCPALNVASERSGLEDATPTDEELASLKDSDTAIWLVQGETDSSVTTDECSLRMWNILSEGEEVTTTEHEGTDGIASGFTTYETADDKFKLSLYETTEDAKLNFAEDYDRDGKNSLVQYSNHWSWIYTLRNNPVDSDGTHIWNWAANYQKAEEPVVSAYDTLNAYTRVGDGQREVYKFEAAVTDPTLIEGLTADDFDITNNISTIPIDKDTGALAGEYADDGIKLTSTENGFQMEVTAFNYKNEWKVTCADNPELSFTAADVDNVYTKTLDDATIGEFTYAGITRKYALYVPESADGPVPLVVWNHGGGEYGIDINDTLVANRGFTAWPEAGYETAVLMIQVSNENYGYGAAKDPAKQSLIDQNNALQAALIRQLIDEGTVDADRVYVTGASSGGGATMRFLMQYPELFAGAIACCSMDPIVPIHQWSWPEDNDFDTIVSKLEEAFQGNVFTWDEESGTMVEKAVDTEALVNVPIWFTHAENDTTCQSTSSKAMFKAFENLGDDNNKISIWSDEEMKEAGIGNGLSGALLHWSWVKVLNDNSEGSPMNWLFQQVKPAELAGTQRLVIDGDDWGPAVTKTILSFDEAVDKASVTADAFTVVEDKEATDFTDPKFSHIIVSAERTVTAAYLSDADGNKVDAESAKYVTLEMAVDPNTGSPFIYDMNTGLNSWCDPYALGVSGVLTVGGTDRVLSVEAVIDLKDPSTRISLVADEFNLSTFKAKSGKEYSYGEYVPEKDNKKNALVIWLHGAGEGGSDNYIDLLGNEVTALAEDEFQNLFGGAYILTPQCPTMWMDSGNNVYVTEDNVGDSIYGDDLFELIDTYVKNHKDIDPERIIIGGCSNGGYMTMKMVLDHPDYFYKAYPICEAYYDAGITDEMIQAVKEGGTEFWFTYALNDTTVNPETTAIPTIERFKKAGIEVHVSEWADVHDTTGRFTNEDGTPYQYNGHWSWTYFFNNENTCKDCGANEWKWLAETVPGSSLETGVRTSYAGYAGAALVSGAAIVAILLKKRKH